jgi:hypothetical protein
VTPNGNPGRESHNNEYACSDREYHPHPAMTIVVLEPQEIAVARAAGGQMIQVRLGLGQWHPVRCNRSDNLPTRASNALGIRELVTKSSAQYR